MLTGYGLADVLGRSGAPVSARSRWSNGWRRLSADLADPALLGRPWWHAWRSQQEPGQHDHGGANPRWLTDVVRDHAVAVLGGALPSHLLPADGAAPPTLRAAVRPVVALADSVGLTGHDWPVIGDPPARPAPAAVTIAALHPAVVGAALALAGSERSRLVDGTWYDAWPLWELAGRDFVLADVPAAARDRIYAAAFVQHRLSGRGAAQELLDQLRHSPWVAQLKLSEAVSDEASWLRDSLALHRLIAAAAHYPHALVVNAAEQSET